MKRLVWLTDIHLNFVSPDDVFRFFHRVQQHQPDVVLIGGDIGEADSFADFIREFAQLLSVPIYFVLGNHDFYHGSISAVRDVARSLHHDSTALNWLPESGVVQLTDQTTLIGHGGWGDGRIGDFLRSDVVLTDYALIQDLRELQRPDGLPPESVLTPELLKKLHELGDEAASHFRDTLPEALKGSRHIVVLTHVPPFREACWHEGQLSDDNWAPHFTCRAVGDVLSESMKRHPGKKMTVLCGHTHSSGRAQILNNLEVITGQAQYQRPSIQQVLEID